MIQYIAYSRLIQQEDGEGGHWLDPAGLCLEQCLVTRSGTTTDNNYRRTKKVGFRHSPQLAPRVSWTRLNLSVVEEFFDASSESEPSAAKLTTNLAVMLQAKPTSATHHSVCKLQKAPETTGAAHTAAAELWHRCPTEETVRRAPLSQG